MENYIKVIKIVLNNIYDLFLNIYNILFKDKGSRKYIIGIFLVALLFYLLSDCHAFDPRFHDVLIHISGALFSLLILIGIYKWLGEDPTIDRLNQLIELQKDAKNIAINIADVGIDQFFIRRGKIDIEKIDADLTMSEREIFILAKRFDAIKYKDVRSILDNFLKKQEDGIVRILISSIAQNETIQKIIEFKNILPETSKPRISVKQIDKACFCIYGSDNYMYITLYLNELSGNESPAFRCKRKNSGISIFKIYKDSFEDLWNMGTNIC